MSELACIAYDYLWLIAFIALIGVAIWFPFKLANGIRRDK